MDTRRNTWLTHFTEKVDVLLRDEKEYIGILRSYDQFGARPLPFPTTCPLTQPSKPRSHRMPRADSRPQPLVRVVPYRARMADPRRKAARTDDHKRRERDDLRDCRSRPRGHTAGRQIRAGRRSPGPGGAAKGRQEDERCAESAGIEERGDRAGVRHGCVIDKEKDEQR